MSEENIICKYTVVIGGGNFCGHPKHPNNHPCNPTECEDYKRLM